MSNKLKRMDLDKELENLTDQVKKYCRIHNIDPQEDDFLFVQPFSKHEAIIAQAEGEKPNRKVNISVVGPNMAYVLPKKEGLLSIFNEGIDSDEKDEN